MNQAQLEQLYVVHGPMVIRRCRALLRHEQDALEASQEVFVKVLENAHTLDLNTSPSSLLYRIATNHCLNRIRAQKHRAKQETQQDMLLLEIARHTEDDTVLVEKRSSLRHLFRRQQDSTRYIAILYWVEEMTLKEVADEVNMSVSGVRKRLRQLKEQIEPTVDNLREVEEH